MKHKDNLIVEKRVVAHIHKKYGRVVDHRIFERLNDYMIVILDKWNKCASASISRKIKPEQMPDSKWLDQVWRVE